MNPMPDAARTPKTIGARGVERFARSGCTRERSILLNNADPGWVATMILGQESNISNYAPRAGENFERQLYANNATQLQQALVASGVLPPDHPIEVVQHHAPATDPEYDKSLWLQRGIDLVLQYMRQGGQPVLALQVALPLQFVGDRQLTIRPDGLLWTGKQWKLIEIKSRIMATRRSESSARLLVSARRQAAVGLLALAQLAQQHEISDQVLDSEEVLLCRSSHYPWVLAFRVPAQGDLNSLRWMLDHDDPEIERWAKELQEQGLTDDVIMRVPHQMWKACQQHCPLLKACLKQAHLDDNPSAVWLEAGDWLPPGISGAQLLEAIQQEQSEVISDQAVRWLGMGWAAAKANEGDIPSTILEARQ